MNESKIYVIGERESDGHVIFSLTLQVHTQKGASSINFRAASVGGFQCS